MFSGLGGPGAQSCRTSTKQDVQALGQLTGDKFTGFSDTAGSYRGQWLPFKRK